MRPQASVLSAAPLPRVGRYQLLTRLGDGPLGVVYVAHDGELERKIALELVPGAALAALGRDALRTRLGEAARVSHPNLVAVHDVGSFDDGLFVARELVEGETLAAWLAAAPRPLAEVVAHFAAAGQGLCAAHAAGVIHGDFGPEHVLLGRDGRVRLGGFGLARPGAHADGDRRRFVAALAKALPAARAPRWLRRVLDHEGALPELVTALSRHRTRQRAALLSLAALVLAALALSAAFMLARPHRVDSAGLCRGAEARWTGVWDPTRAAAVFRAFAGTGKPYAGAAFAAVNRALDGYKRDWIALHGEACAATRVRHVQSEALLERRMLCLDGLLADARAFADRLASADNDVVESAPRALAGLGELNRCADLVGLSSQVPPPADARTRVRVQELAKQLAELKATSRVRYDAGLLERARRLAADARATRYRPLEAEVLFELAWIQDHAGDYAGARASFEQSVWAAEAGKADELAARAWLGEMQVVGQDLRQYDEALAMGPRVTALLERLGENRAEKAKLESVTGLLYFETDRFAEAEQAGQRALTLIEQLRGPEDLALMEPLSLLGDAARQRKPADGLPYYERSLAIARKIYGESHPETAAALDRVASVQWMLGDNDAAIATMKQVIAVYERALGPQHPYLAKALHNLARIYESAGRLEDSLAAGRRAAEIMGAAQGHDHPDYADMLMAVADTLASLERYDEALPVLREVLGVFEQRLGPEHTQVAVCLDVIAQVQYFSKHYPEALAAAQRSQAIQEKAEGEGGRQQRTALLFTGWSELALGAPERALPALEKAYALSQDANPGFFGQIEFALARALVATGGDRARALTLARSARQHMAGTGQMAKETREVERWLARL
jgi:eukaryotic-like serine/threonine-protein kinase